MECGVQDFNFLEGVFVLLCAVTNITCVLGHYSETFSEHPAEMPLQHVGYYVNIKLQSSILKHKQCARRLSCMQTSYSVVGTKMIHNLYIHVNGRYG